MSIGQECSSLQLWAVQVNSVSYCRLCQQSQSGHSSIECDSMQRTDLSCCSWSCLQEVLQECPGGQHSGIPTNFFTRGLRYEFFSGRVQHIPLRTGTEDGDLRAVAPQSGVPLNL
jgi:hypothetical protein